MQKLTSIFQNTPMANRILRSWSAAGLFLAAAMQMQAGNYYIATTGSDTNVGTVLSPWKTVQKAADALKPGDTAYVRAGVYGKVTVNVSGTAADGPVTFCNFPGETPVIDATNVTPPDDDTGLFLLENRSYVVIEGSFCAIIKPPTSP